MTYQRDLDRKRREKNLTLTELAARAGIDLPALSRIINGHVNPQPRTKIYLADALGCKVEEIFPREGEVAEC